MYKRPSDDSTCLHREATLTTITTQTSSFIATNSFIQGHDKTYGIPYNMNIFSCEFIQLITSTLCLLYDLYYCCQSTICYIAFFSIFVPFTTSVAFVDSVREEAILESLMVGSTVMVLVVVVITDAVLSNFELVLTGLLASASSLEGVVSLGVATFTLVDSTVALTLVAFLSSVVAAVANVGGRGSTASTNPTPTLFFS